MASASSSRAPPQQAQDPGTYTVQQGAQLSSLSEQAENTNLVSAANYIIQVLEASRVSYAFMGGFSLLIRGSSRRTKDVDLVVGCNMAQLKDVLKPHSRILRPLGPVSDTVRIFIKTGGQIDPGVVEMWTEVDLILRGCMNAPNDPATASESIAVNTSGVTRQYNLLNIRYAMSTKLLAFFARGEGNDYADLMFLVKRYSEEVWAIKAELSSDHRGHLVNAYARTPHTPQQLKKIKHLLGVP